MGDDLYDVAGGGAGVEYLQVLYAGKMHETVEVEPTHHEVGAFEHGFLPAHLAGQHVAQAGLFTGTEYLVDVGAAHIGVYQKRLQAGMGAGLLVVSAQWPLIRLAHWRALLVARAIENQIFVVACNRCGQTDKTEFAGHSLIIAPDGAVLAEAGAGVESAWVGIDPALTREIRQCFNTVGPAPHRFYDQDKIMELEDLAVLTARYRAVGRKVVFTNGCFDILHQGHVTYLEQARREGDCLIVGVNSDASVRALCKGDDRPVNHEQSRARIIAALGCVDQVVIFSEETPHRLITTLQPEVLVKGADWVLKDIVGAKEVMAWGGKVKRIPMVRGRSSTRIIKRLKLD